MSDQEEQPEEKTEASRKFVEKLYKYIDDPNIRTEFSNRVVSVVLDSDIALYFGVDTQSSDPQEIEVKYSTKIMMSHAYFMDAFEYLAVRYVALAKMYEGQSIRGSQVLANSPERHAEAVKILLGPVPTRQQLISETLNNAAPNTENSESSTKSDKD